MDAIVRLVSFTKKINPTNIIMAAAANDTPGK